MERGSDNAHQRRVPGRRAPERLRRHYEIERELASRLREAPSAHERRRLYPIVYRERSVRIDDHPLVARSNDAAAQAGAARPQKRLILNFAGPSDAFMEVGAGDGAVAFAVAPHVSRSVAIDVTDILAIPDDPSRAYRFLVFDGFDLPDVGELDLVYSNDVVEHLHPDDLRDHLTAIRGALRTGGMYICVTPNRLSGPHDISRHFAQAAQGFHLREYTATELADEMRAAGFGRVRLVLSVGGRKISPMFPVWPISIVECAIGALPTRVRRQVATVLAAVKVVATR
jgi:SAM-dependent methyltransferase